MREPPRSLAKLNSDHIARIAEWQEGMVFSSDLCSAVTYLKSAQDYGRSDSHPASAPAHRLGQRLAAPWRSADADRHRAARRRGPFGARGRARPRGRPPRGPRARPRDAPSPGPCGAGGHDRPTVRGAGGGVRARGRLRPELRRARGGGSPLLARADAPPRRAGAGDRRQRGLLGLHPAHLGGLPRRRRAAGRRDHPRRRPRPARRSPARPQHHRRPARRRARAHRLRRRPPAGGHLVQHRGLPRGRAGRDASAGPGRVPRQPAPDGRHAARPAADRARRRGHRPRQPHRPAARRARPPLRPHRRGAPRRSRRAPSRSPPTCGRRGSSTSSRSSSSGRCSGISTSCSTRAVSRSR